jgi:hypothetical protein
MDISLKVSKVKNTKSVKKTTTYEYAPKLASAEYSTNRMDSPGKFTFTLIEDTGIAIEEGSCIRVKVNGKDFFKGYVFTAERSEDRKVKYTAYDQLRYLKAKASYTFVAKSLEDIIRKIAKDFGLKVGDLAKTGYKFPSLIKENESCLDIIFDALSQTIRQTGKIFVFYDDFGKLTLKEAKKMKWNRLIGSRNELSDYTYKRDIDKDTYNRIKLARPNKNTGKADTYVYEDKDNIKQWGLLQYYDTVDENMNAAQINEMCKTYLKYYNKVWQTLKLKNIIGHEKIRAGWIIPVLIDDIEVASGIQRYFLAEKVTHKLDNNSHTMDIEVKNFNELGVT